VEAILGIVSFSGVLALVSEMAGNRLNERGWRDSWRGKMKVAKGQKGT
jgi:hypothetical protein